MSQTNTNPGTPVKTYRQQRKKELLILGPLILTVCLLLILFRPHLPPAAADVKPEPGATSTQVERAVEDLEEYLHEGYTLQDAVEAFNNEPLRTLTEATIYDGNEYIIHEPVIRDSISYGYAYDSATGEHFITDGTLTTYLNNK